MHIYIYVYIYIYIYIYAYMYKYSNIKKNTYAYKEQEYDVIGTFYYTRG